MNDVQASKERRGIPLNQVGVRGLRYPIVFFDKAHRRHEAAATISMAVNLPHDQRGIHMSRLLAVLKDHHENIGMQTLADFLRNLRAKQGTEDAHVEITFPFFLERVAPVSQSRAFLGFDCRFIGEMKGEDVNLTMEVHVPVTSLCPCSRDISDYGAHNQRGIISISVRPTMDKDGNPRQIWFEDLIEVAEACGSSPIYALLKREDEKFVTELAYDNPVFVEDMTRNVVGRLQKDPRIAWFRVTSENQESIHSHQAVALTEWSRNPKVA